MWTPRRVLLLILGAVLFGTAFGVYARFLGWIDGLPQLPDEFLARRSAEDGTLPPATTSITNAKLQKAFPGYCPEVTWKIQIELRAKGIVFAADQHFIEPDGRMKLSPFSLATFKERGPGVEPEINTVHCDVAFLEFDRPVKKFGEVLERRIVACELVSDPNLASHDPRRGQIHFANNRATPSPNDDLVLETPGPVQFREAVNTGIPLDKAEPQIKTNAAVKLVDKRHQPQATTIDAQGMLVYLAPDPPAPAGGAPRPKTRPANVSGVRRVVLPGNVRMNLWMEPGSGFLETANPKPATAVPPTPTVAKPPAGKSAERTNVLITTLGRFTYDVLPEADRARFDRLPPEQSQLADFVRVVRPQFRGPDNVVNDQLECDHLEMQFAPRPDKKADPKNAAAPKVSEADRAPGVEWVHAWGQTVVLTSDEERLEARGNDLFHDARTKRTTLKGAPEMVAVKDANEIHAAELILFGAESAEGQQAQARGAGFIRLRDQARDGKEVRREARWRDQLVYRKEGDLDRITLTGSATFSDPDAGQMIRGDQLKLLLGPDGSVAAKPADSPPAKAKPAESSAGMPRRRPRSLEAIGHVAARSAELVIHDTEQLVLLFQDEAGPPTAGAAPAQSAAPAPAAPAPVLKPESAKPNGPPPKPIDLTARTVQVIVRRRADKNELHTVHCEDRVRVHQDPPAPNEKPIHMHGRSLQLTHTPAGNVLVVTGTLDDHAAVHFPELELFGPRVTINQPENFAQVEGIGGMRLDSQTDFQGNKLKQPMPLVVTWKQNMHFDGSLARFHGQVQASQDNTVLLCHNMQVYLTRPVSLSQAPEDRKRPGNQAANVDRVVCDVEGQPLPQPVTIEESVRNARGVLAKYQRIESTEVEIHKENGVLDAKKGTVRILQLGPKSAPGQLPLAAAPRPQADGKPLEEEHKLTWVRYATAMRANNQSRTVKFWGKVDVLHMPHPDPGLNLDFDQMLTRLPTGALRLSCERLEVYNSKEADGRSRQTMRAEGKAMVQWQDEFMGWADVVKFDEEKQQVVLEGTDDNLAVVKQYRVRGDDSGTLSARKLTYERLTGNWKTEGARIFSSGPLKK